MFEYSSSGSSMIVDGHVPGLPGSLCKDVGSEKLT